MSFGGILATALAGGAGVIQKQAGDDIEATRRADLMRQQADIEEQMRMRLAEFSEKQRRSGVLWETSGEGGAAKREYRKGELADAAQADIDKARGMIPVTQEAARATAKTAADITKEQAADPAYLKSISVLKLADPEVRARIAASAASANASAQQVKESAERLKQLQAVGEVATKVRGLQDTLSKTTEPAQRQAVEQQITDLGFNGKDIKSFLSTAERAMTNGDTAMKVLLDPSADEATKEAARRQLAQANQFAEKAAGLAGIKLDATKTGGAPPVGTEVGGYVFKGGDPNDKKNWAPKGAAKPAASPSMLKTQPLDMEGITFAGDGYKVNGQTYPTLDEARKARDAAKTRSNSPMTQSLSRYGDD